MAISEAIRSASATEGGGRLMRPVSAQTAASQAERLTITAIGSRNFIWSTAGSKLAVYQSLPIRSPRFSVPVTALNVIGRLQPCRGRAISSRKRSFVDICLRR